MGRLGANPSAPLVASRRSRQEKPPWREMPAIENPVETEFLRPVLLGESILPYRVFRPFEGVIPVTQNGHVFDAEGAANRGFEGLSGWLRKAEAAWEKHRSSPDSLIENLNHYGKLASQFPIATVRTVYAKAGTLPAACIVRDRRTVIDHKLYWMAPSNENEANYLAAILNSETGRARVAQFQSRGQWGARDFDKVMFNLPIPRFDPARSLHSDLATAGARAERAAALVELPENVRFQRARAMIRTALTEAGIAQTIDGLVTDLLDGAS
jgi:hypothetical protein